MKSERPQLKPFESSGPAADAFQAFFDMVDAPAALCDLSLTVLTANSPFEVLAGRKDLVGRALAECLGASSISAPEEERPVDLEVTLKSGQQVTLTVSRRGQTVAVVARRLSPMLDSLAAAGRALIEQARVESQLLEIGRNVAGSTGEEELVATVARGVKGLFPGRTFVVRIVDPRTCALTSLYAEGRLRDGPRDVFHLRRSMVEKTNLETGHLPQDKVVVSTGELPLVFLGSVRGIAAPLVASGQLVGAINVEYPAGLTADVVADERILIQLANQVAVAVRNAKLIDELTFVRKYLEELLENANALIVVTNREGKVVVFNRALTRLAGWTKAEVLGRDLNELVAPSMRLMLMRVLSDALVGQAQAAFETVLLTKDGREARVTMASSAVVSQSGDIEGVIAIGQDLSRMRDLERRVVQAEKLASLGQLAASVVHEINNPMTAVATYADALLSRASTSLTADPNDVSKYRKIVENTDRVLRFTRDLVSYARPAQDTPEEVDLNATIERAIGFCEHVLHKHGITLERAFGEVPRFLAVRQNLVQVFVNLITNACHATPPGGRISVTTRAHDGQAVIELRDSGAGIPDDVKQRIFEPFFTTKPDGKGTGLGLSIVQGIVENHGGRITVDSTPGAGSTFAITLPMVHAV
ncbi:MAG: PAS domain S-box protein [Myxococcaceae bacterium]|nr:PAS domain S-box protein [Myxococcaceae bacterium]